MTHVLVCGGRDRGAEDWGLTGYNQDGNHGAMNTFEPDTNPRPAPKSLVIYMPEDLQAQVTELAASRHISKSRLCVQAIRFALDHMPEPHSAKALRDHMDKDGGG